MTESTRRYSPSRLQTYTRCQHAYYLEKVARAPQRQAGWFIQGTAVHSAIEAYERSFRMLDLNEVLTVFTETWNREMEKALDHQPHEQMWMVGGRRTVSTDIRIRFEQGQQQVRSYLERNTADADPKTFEFVPGEPAIEMGFELDLGEFSVVGYIDQVLEDPERGLIPQDWKTGSRIPSSPYQLATYKVALEELTGEAVVCGRFWMCRTNEPVVIDLTPFTKSVVRDWYEQLHRGVLGEVFLPNPGDACFTCSVLPSCPFSNVTG